MQQNMQTNKCTLTAIVALVHKARKRNSPYTLHAVSLESRVIDLHAEVMFICQLCMQVQWF